VKAKGPFDVEDSAVRCLVVVPLTLITRRRRYDCFRQRDPAAHRTRDDWLQPGLRTRGGPWRRRRTPPQPTTKGSDSEVPRCLIDACRAHKVPWGVTRRPMKEPWARQIRAVAVYPRARSAGRYRRSPSELQDTKGMRDKALRELRLCKGASLAASSNPRRCHLCAQPVDATPRWTQ
jgi:hypothetical protein